MNYFYKFDSGIKLDHSMSKFEGVNNFNFISGDGSIHYSKVTNAVDLAREYFSQRIFGIEPHLIYYADVPGPGFLEPHRDHGATVVANFYFESLDAVTTFFEPRDSAVKTTNYLGDGMQDSNIYKLNELMPVANFQAQDGDSYLLDVSKIHAVYLMKPGRRRFINMQWYGVDIDTVYNSILK
jgi:hypothetical protein